MKSGKKLSKQKGKFINISTKISAADYISFRVIVEQRFNMTVYEFLQSIALSILRYFDKGTTLSDEGNELVESLLQVVIKQGHGHTIITDEIEPRDLQGAIFFINNKKYESPMTLAYWKDLLCGWIKDYNTDDMLAKLLQSNDAEALHALEYERDRIKHFSIARTLHHIAIEHARSHPMPAETIEDEIRAMFDDASRAINGKVLEYGERANRKKHYDPDTLTRQPWMQSNQSDGQGLDDDTPGGQFNDDTPGHQFDDDTPGDIEGISIVDHLPTQSKPPHPQLVMNLFTPT